MDSPEEETEAKEGADIQEGEEDMADYGTSSGSGTCSMLLYFRLYDENSIPKIHDNIIQTVGESAIDLRRSELL